jgi:hypothetical protein
MANPTSYKDYRDGDMLACQQCGKKAQVRWFPTKQSALVPPGEREKLILRCQACGFITCNQCAHPGDSMFPVCPNCQKEWGPYYFIGGPAAPLSPIDSVLNEVPADKQSDLSWEQALRMELPHMRAEDVTLAADESKPKRFSRLRGSPLILLVFLLIGVIIAAVVFVVLRLPAIARLQASATPTAMQFDANAAAATPTLAHNQAITIEGNIKAPGGDADCEKAADGFRWCRTWIQVEDMVVVVWVQTGKPANALTADWRFLDSDGSLILSGSQVSVEGVADCLTENTCQIRVQKIRTLLAAEPTLTPTLFLSPTPTRTPTPTRRVTSTPVPTVTPTESGCVDALSVTLDSLGEELCVQGIVSEVFIQDQAVLLLFEKKETTSFMFVSYGPPLDFVEVGMCVVGTGSIQRLGNRPVIVVTYKSLVERCPE